MKKIISIALTLVILFSLLPMQTFAANQYTDTAGNWAEQAIDRWSESGVIVGSNGKFDPNGTLTRAQMATILSRLLALPEAKSAGFSDVKGTDWYAPYIDRCFAAGIMLGSDGKAQPNDPITREQAIVMLGRALGIKPMENADLSGYTDADTVSDWAKGYVAAMAEAGIVKGTSVTTVSPKASIDRAATVTILDRAIGTYANVDGAEVTAADGGIILIAADNVKVTGAAKGATVIVSPSADGVTVNGVSVAAGTTITAVEEKQKQPVVSGGGSYVPSYSDLTISEAKNVTSGTYNNMTITSAVGNGDVTLSGVTIRGKLIVQGGGSNSIHLNGCTVDTIEVSKDTTAQDAQTPRIELNNTPVEKIVAIQPVIIEADTASIVKSVEAKSDVTVQGAATKVEAITVPENVAAEPTINVAAGTVETVEAKSAAKIEGAENTVSNIKAEAPVEVASEAVITVTVTAEVTITVTGDAPVEIAVAAPVAVSIAAENDNKVEVSTTVETGVSVTVNEAPVSHVHTWGTPSYAWEAAEGGYTCTAERVCTLDGSHKDAETVTATYAVTTPAGAHDGVGTYTATFKNAAFEKQTKAVTLSVTYTPVTTSDAFISALNDPTVTGILVNGDITVSSNDPQYTSHSIQKPVVVASGKTLTVAGYTGTMPAAELRVFNDLRICGGGSLTLAGGATLATAESNGNGSRCAGRVYVESAGELFDVSEGTVTDNCCIYYEYSTKAATPDSSNLVVDPLNIPNNIAFAVGEEDELRAALADSKCTGGINAIDSIVLTADLTLSGALALDARLTVPSGKTLTVPQGAELYVFSDMLVQGTLVNAGSITNFGVIDVIGGTLNNSGTISGMGNEENGYESEAAIEHGSFTNTGTINDYMDFVDYYNADGTVQKCTVVQGTTVKPAWGKIAVGFGTAQAQTAMNTGDYEAVIVCGTDAAAVWNTVELGGLTVPEGMAIVLKETLFDGADTYHNKYAVSEDKTLTFGSYAGMLCRGNIDLNVLGSLNMNSSNWIVRKGDLTLGGRLVDSTETLKAALAKGGDIYLLPFTDAVGEGEDRVLIYGEKITVNNSACLISLGAEPIYCGGGIAISSGKTLTLNGTVMVLAADSTISGTVELRSGSVLMVRTPDEAEAYETTELTIAEGGKLIIGEECAVLANSERWSIVNNGTIEKYGMLREDEGHFINNGTLLPNEE